jgi:hypothetical protein
MLVFTQVCILLSFAERSHPQLPPARTSELPSPARTNSSLPPGARPSTHAVASRVATTSVRTAHKGPSERRRNWPASANRSVPIQSASGCTHPPATRLLEARYDVRTAQELLGHQDVKTTMIHARVLNKGDWPPAARWIGGKDGAGYRIDSRFPLRLMIRHLQVGAIKQNRPPTGSLPLKWSVIHRARVGPPMCRRRKQIGVCDYIHMCSREQVLRSLQMLLRNAHSQQVGLSSSIIRERSCPVLQSGVQFGGDGGAGSS